MNSKNFKILQEIDIKKGNEAEERLFNIFKMVFDAELQKDPNKYAIFDFFSNKSLVELKSRNNNYNDYPSTMIGASKVQYGLKSKKLVYFVFEFLDGLYYWKLNEKELAEFETKKGGTLKRGKPEFNQYVFIPINKLKRITTNNSPPTTDNILFKCILDTEDDYNNTNSNILTL